MKAMSLARPGPVSPRSLTAVEIADPVPAADELLLEITACGVCRTDLHIVEGELAPPSYPVVPGHQVVGRVRSAGAQTAGFHAGDRVGVAWVGRFCGRCDYCVEGRENLCEAPVFTGFHRQGGFAERITVAAAYAHPIPENLGDDAHVAPLLCAGIIGYRALKQSGLRPGSRLALVGFGGSAHIALQIALAWGCEVYVVSRDRMALERARAMGAHWTGLGGERLPRLVDHAVSFAPAGAVIPQIMQDLRRGGTLALAGIYVDRVPELDYDRHLFQEKTLVTTTANTRADARELLALAARLDLRTDVRTFALEEANEALLHLKENRLGAQAGVLRIEKTD